MVKKTCLLGDNKLRRMCALTVFVDSRESVRT
jgi:hypothetical protein